MPCRSLPSLITCFATTSGSSVSTDIGVSIPAYRPLTFVWLASAHESAGGGGRGRPGGRDRPRPAARGVRGRRRLRRRRRARQDRRQRLRRGLPRPQPARHRALLRRDAGRSGALLRVGDLQLDAARHQARRDGRPLALTPKEFALLRYFMSRPGQVLSQEDLLEPVWDEHADPFTNTVRVTVMTLRRKLADVGEGQPIETVVGRGYRLREEL